MLPRLLLALLFFGFVCLQWNHAQQIIYVNLHAAGNNNGLTWTDAYTDLQLAIEEACESDSAQIWVAAGTYYPVIPFNIDSVTEEERAFSFSMCNHVALYGGFLGIEMELSERNWNLYQSILSGNIDLIPSRSNNSFNVLKATKVDPTAILDGFIVTQGESQEFGQQGIPPSAGSGMYIDSASPKIIHCLFTSNRSHAGGGIYMRYASPQILNCDFTLNSAEGAGIMNNNSNPVISNCRFSKNSSAVGGGIYNFRSSPMMINCVFENNNNYYYGTCYNYNSSPVLTNCAFVNNVVTQKGGAMYNEGNSNLVLDSCTFLYNKSGLEGGGIYNDSSTILLTACTFDSNAVTGNFNLGGAMWNANATITIVDCSFLHNDAHRGGAIYTTKTKSTIINSVFYSNTGSFAGGIDIQGSSPAFIKGCTFSENDGFYSGGALLMNSNRYVQVDSCHFIGNTSMEGSAIYVSGDSVLQLTNCLFSANKALEYGGAIDMDLYGHAEISGCVFEGNRAGLEGGAIYIQRGSHSVVNNSLFSNNSVEDTLTGLGGGIMIADSSSVFINCTFSNNRAAYGNSVATISSDTNRIINCILWDTMDELFASDSSILDVTYSLIGEGYAGEGNVAEDPLFVAANSFDFNLQQESPAINRGTPDTTGLFLPPHDLSGKPRVIYNRIDMGALEYDGPLTATMDLSHASMIIFPNPSTGKLYLSMNENRFSGKEIQAKIYDIQGRLIFSTKINSRIDAVVLPENLANGIYSCQLQQGDVLISRHFILHRN